MMTHFRQQGSTLLVSLIMLIILTLFVVTAINVSNVNLKIVGNVQSKKTLEANAQQAIEQVLSSSAAFNLTPTAQTITVNGTNVAIAAAVCRKAVTAPSYSLTSGPVPEDTNWELVATATDPANSAAVTVKQGVKIRLPPGNCP